MNLLQQLILQSIITFPMLFWYTSRVDNTFLTLVFAFCIAILVEWFGQYTRRLKIERSVESETKD